MERFGRYELIKKIATGGMAEIWLARQAGLEGFEKLIVLKRILPHLAENEEFVEMFLHEARVAVRLNHPNIVQIFDLGKESGAFFIAMEYIHGEDARRVWKTSEMQGNPIPIPLVCRIAMDSAAGLDYAHKKTDPTGAPLNIIHRDVSPQNLLVSFEGAVKVVDFGIAKAADQASQTRSGVLKGKYSYMSPEQASGKEIDQRTDQFALGVVLWELLTLKRLFKRGTDIQTLAAVTECKVPNPWEVSERVPVDLGQIAMKAMAKNPNDRFRDLHEMQLALEDWLLANRQPSSPSHLAGYLASIYKDRLERERLEGQPVFVEGQDPSGSVDQGAKGRSSKTDRRRTGLSNANRPVEGSPETRAARPGGKTGSNLAPRPAPEPEPADSDERTPVESSISGSSVSRLVDRLSGRKKAAIGVALVAVLAAAGGIFYQSQVGSTTRPPAGTGPEPTPPKPQQAVGALKIVTTPPGASVLLDAKPLGERTPTTVPNLPLGSHKVFVELEGYEDQVVPVNLEREGELVNVPIVLKARVAPSAKLSVESSPPGAEISLDGKSVGKAPVTVEVTAGRSVEIEATKEGYLTRRQMVTMGEAPQKAVLELERRAGAVVGAQPAGSGSGTLVVTCEPPATVWAGSKELGPTPLKVKLPAGRHQLVLANRDEGLEYAFSVVVRSDETVTKPYKFDRGEVQVVVKPVTMDATIYLRNRKLGSNPLPKFSLLEGEYQLTVVNEELKKAKRVPVTVKRGELTKVTINLADD